MNCQKSEQRNDSSASDEYFAEGFSGGNNCEAPHKRAARSKLFDAARRSVIKNLLKECDGYQLNLLNKIKFLGPLIIYNNDG